MARTKQTIYKTKGGCYRVGKRYFAYYDGALRASTPEECKGLEKDTYLVDEDVLKEVIGGMTNGDTYLVDEEDLKYLLRTKGR